MALVTFLHFSDWKGFSDSPEYMAAVDYKRKLDEALFPLPVWFDRAGLEHVETFGAENPASDFYGLTFENPESKVRVEISIDLIEGAVTAFVVGRKRSFSLREYLTYKNRDHEFRRDFLGKNVETFVTNLCRMIGGEWASIIHGQQEEPLPQDWPPSTTLVGHNTFASL